MNMDRKPFEGDTHIPAELIKLRDNFDLACCVETGTEYGVTAKALSKIFEEVITIEADDKNYAIANENITEENILLIHGKSEKYLWHIDCDYALYYLDAHGSNIGGTPLKKELEMLAKKSYSRICIAIHDFKVPNKDFGYDTYDYELCYEEIESYLKLIYPEGFECHYNEIADGARRGIIYIYPHQK